MNKKEFKDTPYIKIPKCVLYDVNLNSTQFRLICLMYSMSGKDSKCWPSQTTLGKLLNLKKTAIYNNTQIVKERGLVKSDLTKAKPDRAGAQKNASNIYTVLPVELVYGDKAKWNDKQWIKYHNERASEKRTTEEQKLALEEVQKSGSKRELSEMEQVKENHQLTGMCVGDGVLVPSGREENPQREIKFIKGLISDFKDFLKEKNSEVLNLPEKFEVETMTKLLDLERKDLMGDLKLIAKTWPWLTSKYPKLGTNPYSLKTLASSWRDTIFRHIDKGDLWCSEDNFERFSPTLRALIERSNRRSKNPKPSCEPSKDDLLSAICRAGIDTGN